MRILLTIGLAFAACGCTSAADPSNYNGPLDYLVGEKIEKITFPDGAAGYVVYCERGGVSACYERARNVCKGNYTIRNRVESTLSADRRVEISCG